MPTEYKLYPQSQLTEQRNTEEIQYRPDTTYLKNEVEVTLLDNTTSTNKL